MSHVNRRQLIRRGSILPLALIMTMIILMAGIGIGTVVLEGSQRAKDTDQSVSAYYMADSGIERQLFEIRKRNRSLAYISTITSAYPNAGAWISTAALEQAYQKLIPAIGLNEFSELDLFNPDSLSASADLDEIQVNWTGDAQIEAGYAQWTSGATVMWPSEDAYVIQQGFAPRLVIPGLDPTRAYRLRLRAVNGSATNVRISVFKNGIMQPFPGDIALGAEGTFGKATQKIAVTMPKQDVLSGLYSYVLFSECQLLKGVAGAPICP